MISLYKFIIESSDQSALISKFKQKYNSLYKKINHTFPKKHDILVVSTCGATKYDKRDIKARELYKGQANQILNVNLPELDACDWVIFSGGFGTMHSEAIIHTYTDVIMELSKESLRSLADFCKYQEDLCKQLDKGYKICVLDIGIVWWTMLNMEELSEKYPDTKFMCFNHNEDLPSNFYNVSDSMELFKKLHSTRACFGSKATAYYIAYLKDHEYITIDKFIDRFKSGSAKVEIKSIKDAQDEGDENEEDNED